MQILESQKTLHLNSSVGTLIDALNTTFRWKSGGAGLYVQEHKNNRLILSNKGMIETKILIDIDELRKKVTLQTLTISNYFLFAGLTLFFLILLWSLGFIELTWFETGAILGLEMWSLFIILAIDRWYTLRKVIRVLKEKELIA